MLAELNILDTLPYDVLSANEVGQIVADRHGLGPVMTEQRDHRRLSGALGQSMSNRGIPGAPAVTSKPLLPRIRTATESARSGRV